MCMIVRNLLEIGCNLPKLLRARHLGLVVLPMINSSMSDPAMWQ
jgi:hypothetical protein